MYMVIGVFVLLNLLLAVVYARFLDQVMYVLDKSKSLRNSYLLEQFYTLSPQPNKDGQMCLDFKGMRNYMLLIHELAHGVESVNQSELSEELRQKALDVFAQLDQDSSGKVDRKEALKHWEGNFSKLSAREFFDQTDFDNDGQVTISEFIRFW